MSVLLLMIFNRVFIIIYDHAKGEGYLKEISFIRLNGGEKGKPCLVVRAATLHQDKPSNPNTHCEYDGWRFCQRLQKPIITNIIRNGFFLSNLLRNGWYFREVCIEDGIARNPVLRVKCCGCNKHISFCQTSCHLINSIRNRFQASLHAWRRMLM